MKDMRVHRIIPILWGVLTGITCVSAEGETHCMPDYPCNFENAGGTGGTDEPGGAGGIGGDGGR